MTSRRSCYTVQLWRLAASWEAERPPDHAFPILAESGTVAERIALGMYPRYEVIAVQPSETNP